jgi:universal stress protein A
MHIRTILVPTDFSPYSETALYEALSLAAQVRGHTLLLHVIPKLADTLSAELWMMRERLEQEIQAEAEKKLGVVGASGRTRIERLVVWGDPASEICRVAREQGTDLIVMGTHGRTGLAHLFLGSVAEQIIRHASCPVLIVPTRYEGEEYGRQGTHA